MAMLRAVRGMSDVPPERTPAWRRVERAFQETAARFGYQEIRFPMLERTELFRRSIGDATDIVEKEMYTFEDRNGDSLSLRPEGTAGCARAAEQLGLLHQRRVRLWYQGPMFRHERPQKGRYRQFQQFGAEAFGMSGPDVDAELVQLAAALWERLDVAGALTLVINNVGGAEDRRRYGAALSEYFMSRAGELDEEARERARGNPVRLLDSKDPAVIEVAKDAPKLEDHVGEESRRHYREWKAMLRALGIAFEESPQLVRGLDYYNCGVHEWVTDALGAQNAVCGGGRYDGLTAQLGGRPTPAAGFAVGVERLVLLAEALGKEPPARAADVAVLGGEGAEALAMAARLRRRRPDLRVVADLGGGKLSSRIRRALESGARAAVVLERADDGPAVRIRAVDDASRSVTVAPGEAPEALAAFLGAPDA